MKYCSVTKSVMRRKCCFRIRRKKASNSHNSSQFESGMRSQVKGINRALLLFGIGTGIRKVGGVCWAARLTSNSIQHFA